MNPHCTDRHDCTEHAIILTASHCERHNIADQPFNMSKKRQERHRPHSVNVQWEHDWNGKLRGKVGEFLVAPQLHVFVIDRLKLTRWRFLVPPLSSFLQCLIL